MTSCGPRSCGKDWREPVQVVARRAVIPVTRSRWLARGPVTVRRMAGRLLAACPSSMDLRVAPLVRLHAAAEPGAGGVYALLQVHHLVQDHTALEVVLGEVRAVLGGEQDRLPEPLPFREFVARARLGVSREEHEKFFAGLLGDVTEPTAPFGVLDVQQDGSGITEGVGAGG